MIEATVEQHHAHELGRGFDFARPGEGFELPGELGRLLGQVFEEFLEAGLGIGIEYSHGLARGIFKEYNILAYYLQP